MLPLEIQLSVVVLKLESEFYWLSKLQYKIVPG